MSGLSRTSCTVHTAEQHSPSVAATMACEDTAIPHLDIQFQIYITQAPPSFFAAIAGKPRAYLLCTALHTASRDCYKSVSPVAASSCLLHFIRDHRLGPSLPPRSIIHFRSCSSTYGKVTSDATGPRCARFLFTKSRHPRQLNRNWISQECQLQGLFNQEVRQRPLQRLLRTYASGQRQRVLCWRCS